MTHVGDPLDALQEALGHRFAEPQLLLQALTHRSYRNEHGGADNERLEFLGDAALSLIVANLLFQQEPAASEGQLTRKRAELVCERGLFEVAEELELGEVLRLGKGEDRSGGRTKSRLLASAFEALIGAVLLDADFARAREVVHALFVERAEQAHAERDAKSLLQERAQRDGFSSPSYRLVGSDGPEHDRTFHAEVAFGDAVRGRGVGRSKARAEQAAAVDALSQYVSSEVEAS